MTRHQLFSAAQRGDLETVKALLQNHSIRTTVPGYPGTVFHTAAAGGHVHLVAFFIQQGYVKPAVTTGNGYTLKGMFAIKLSNQVDVNAVTTMEETALWLAAKFGSVEIVNMLLDIGADPSIAPTPLHIACHYGHYRVVETLLDRYFLPYSKATHQGIARALWQAASNGHTNVVKVFLNRGLCILQVPTSSKFRPFSLAVLQEASRADTGTMMLNRSITQDHPLFAAAKEGHVEIVTLLLGANPLSVRLFRHGEWRSALHYAAEGGHLTIIDILLKAGADPNTQQTPRTFSPLQAAINSTSLQNNELRRETVRLLLERGANVKTRGHYNNTALHYAAKTKDLEIVKMIVEKGVEINALNDQQATPLLEASKTGHFEIVLYLLEHGAQTSIQNSEGMTELSRALWDGHLPLVDIFLQNRTTGFVEEILVLASITGYRGRRQRIHDNLTHGVRDRRKGEFILGYLKKKERELVKANPRYPYVRFWVRLMEDMRRFLGLELLLRLVVRVVVEEVVLLGSVGQMDMEGIVIVVVGEEEVVVEVEVEVVGAVAVAVVVVVVDKASLLLFYC